MQTGPVSLGQLAQQAAAGRDKQRAEAGQDDLRETARQFEALFVKQLLAEVDIAGTLGGADNAQSDFINSMWRDKISQQMVQGEGLGLSAMLERQLGGAKAPPGGGSELSRSLLPLQRRGAEIYSLYGTGATTEFADRQEFVAALRPYVEDAAQQLGVSPQILLAQAALETGWGQHMPRSADGRPTHNLFGIKADGSWQGPSVNSLTQEFRDGEFAEESAAFREYPNFADSVRDYVEFLRSNPRYREALSHDGSDKNFLQGLKSAGYATDPNYVDKVVGVAHSPSMARYWNAI